MSKELGQVYNDLAEKYYSAKNNTERRKIRDQIVGLADTTLSRTLPYIVGQKNLQAVRSRMSMYEDDLRQEFLIVLLDTLSSYQNGKGKSFYNYFYFNIRRKIYNFVKRCDAKKRATYVRMDELYGNNEDDRNQVTLDIVFTPEGAQYKDEVNVTIESPRDEANTNLMKELVLKHSVGFEKVVMNDVLYSTTKCSSLSSIARKHHVSVPTISNAINRVKAKVRSRVPKADLLCQK
jgi:DNA-directed RNA polymerase specialized sigma24 family protein